MTQAVFACRSDIIAQLKKLTNGQAALDHSSSVAKATLLGWQNKTWARHTIHLCYNAQSVPSQAHDVQYFCCHSSSITLM